MKETEVNWIIRSGLIGPTACGTSQVTAQSTGGWERFTFAEATRFVLAGSIGVG